MTSTLDLYEAKGKLLRTGAVTLVRTGAQPTTTVIAGIAGKRIVPAWAVYTAVPGTGSTVLQISIRSSATVDSNRSQFLVDHMSVSPNYSHPYFFDFGGREKYTLGIGDGLQFWYYATASTLIAAARLNVGYYLLDG